MQTYILENTADKEKFFKACEMFESEHPDFKAFPVFEDKSNKALYKRYERFQSVTVISLETLWQERITLKTNIDLNEFLRRYENEKNKK